MITLRLTLPGLAETVLTLPEREGRPDALDLLDAAVARVEGGDWRAVLDAARRSVGIRLPTEAPPSAPGPSSGALALPVEASDPPVSGVRETSRVAYEGLKARGRLTRQQAELVAFLRANPVRDWTRAELAEGIGWRVNVICGRVNELLQEPFPALQEVARRRCAVTGETAMAIATVGAS